MKLTTLAATRSPAPSSALRRRWPRRRTLSSVAAGAFAFAVAGHASALEEESFDGFSDASRLTLVGNAAIVETREGALLALTDDVNGQASAAFATAPVGVGSFSTSFAFRLSDPSGLADVDGHSGGDGFTFAIQPPGVDLGGEHGHGLGIAGVSPSVAVEFDTWDNDCVTYPDVCDPSSNHVGIDLNGDVHSVVTANVTPAMDNGEVWYVWIDYDGASLEVRLSEATARPAAPLISFGIDIPKALGLSSADQAFVGFTASTGASAQNQDILAWYYDTPALPGGVPPHLPSPDAGAGVRLGGGALACAEAPMRAASDAPDLALGGALLTLCALARRRSTRHVR
jgi:hypothetical protein